MNRKILILDDEPAVIGAYQAIFAPAPAPVVVASSRNISAAPAIAPTPAAEVFEVTYVQNGLDALKRIDEAVRNKEPFVGGFFDVKLGPGIDGIETIRQAKEKDPNLLCVITTAYQDRSVEEITKLFGEEYSDRWDFLNKPFTHSEILQKARHLIADWDRRRREREYLHRIESQQEQLVRSERLAAVGILARGIGHEFGNILLRIIGKAELTLQNKKPEEMEETLKVIVAAALRAGVIVRNLQGMVKIESKREVCSVQVPIQESLALIQHELREASVTVKESYAQNLPTFSLNRVEMGQVFLNLFINATHAMKANGKGELKISVSYDNKNVTIQVGDSGSGISKENLSRIFEPLFTTKGEKGTGIGLSVSKKIVENHNGQISVDSEVGKGTTFTIVLPLPAKGETA